MHGERGVIRYRGLTGNPKNTGVGLIFISDVLGGMPVIFDFIA